LIAGIAMVTIITTYPNKTTTKIIFENSKEQYYNHTRAWNATMSNEFNTAKADSPHNWWTGITLYRIGEIDPISGTYELDFNYWVQIFENDDKTNLQDEKSFSIDFVNSVGTQKDFFEKSKGVKQKNHYYDTMVNGKFYSNMNFTKFPFETLKLKIIIEPGKNDAGGYNDVLSSTIQFQRWPYPVLFAEGVPSPEYDIINYAVSIEDHKYSEGDIYSRYVAEFELKRDFDSAFLQYIFPIIVMALLATAALIFPSEEYMTKIELNAIFLLGILFFVQVVAEEIPPTGDMTIFDTVVILGYVVIIVTMAIPAIKWGLRIKFERMEEDYEEWKDQDRRYHDLHVEKQKRIQLRLTYLMEKIHIEGSPVEIDRIKDEIKLFEKLRIQVINLKNIEEDMTSVAATDVEEFKQIQEKVAKIEDMEVKRKELDDKINETTDEIKKNSKFNLTEYYNRNDYIQNDKIFEMDDYFANSKELEIVSWGYTGHFDTLTHWNYALNGIGFGLVIGISIYGFKLLESIYHG